MPTLRTHYRNLKVPEDADDAAIRAAYRRLSRRYHPDRNPDNPEALRIMQLVNEAYRVLSDPEQRRQHDQWIAAQRQPARGQTLLQQTAARHRIRQSNRRHFWLITAAGILIGLLVVQTAWWLMSGSVSGRSEAKPHTRPATAPNGSPWPLYADYISGYPQLGSNGTAIATLSNPGEDRMVELQQHNQQQWQTIRTLYLPHKGHFTVYSLGSGRYRLIHTGLDSGLTAGTEAWQLEKTGEPPIYSDVTVTLPP